MRTALARIVTTEAIAAAMLAAGLGAQTASASAVQLADPCQAMRFSPCADLDTSHVVDLRPLASR